MTPRIRPINWRADRAAVMSFQKEIYETNFPGFTVSVGFLRDYEAQLRQATRSQMERVLVLEDSTGVCGFVWMALVSTMVEPLVGYIKNMYVAPALRGQGWGGRLLAEADQWFESHACPKAALDATVSNAAAVAAYRKAGYEPARYRMEKPYHPPTSAAGCSGEPW